uniref:Gag protein n=1 Tax=Human immunodeficiency virus type 1 TaxID=11676 RepID=K0GPD0_HV1|nr:gag protein [Human immunodeficiency virus 1]
MGCEKRQY